METQTFFGRVSTLLRKWYLIINKLRNQAWPNPARTGCRVIRKLSRKRADIDILPCTTRDESRQRRPRGSAATEWHTREPQAPEGKGTAALKFSTAAELKCWSLSTHCATTSLHISRKTVAGDDIHCGLLH